MLLGFFPGGFQLKTFFYWVYLFVLMNEWIKREKSGIRSLNSNYKAEQ